MALRLILTLTAVVVVAMVAIPTGEAQGGLGYAGGVDAFINAGHVSGRVYCTDTILHDPLEPKVISNATVELRCDETFVAMSTAKVVGAYTMFWLVPSPQPVTDYVVGHCYVVVETPNFICDSDLPSVRPRATLIFIGKDTNGWVTTYSFNSNGFIPIIN